MRKSVNALALNLALILTFLLPTLASADALETVQIHGFVSQGYLVSDNNDFLANTKAGSLEFNEIGLNFVMEPVQKLRIGIQLFSRDLGAVDKDRVDLDWAFADYHWRDELGVRVGRCKTPMGLFHDAIDLDMTRTTIFLPLVVYDIRVRNSFMGVNGIQVYGNIPMKFLGNLDYVAFFGTNTANPDSLKVEYSALMDLEEVSIKDMYGGRLIWNTPLNGLLFGGSYLTAVNFEARGKITPQLTAPIAMLGGLSIYPAGTEAIHKSKEIIVWYGFTQYTRQKLSITGEFYRLHMNGNLATSQPFDPFVGALIGFNGLPSSIVNRAGWYAQVNYQFLSWLTAATTYGEAYNDWNDREGHNYSPSWTAFQKDTTLSLRFDINAHWNVKLETHFMDGAGLLMAGEEIDTRRWNLYAIKTSVYF